MPEISTLPDGAPLAIGDYIIFERGGQIFRLTVAEFFAQFQATLLLQQNTLVGRTTVGTGGPQQVGVGLIANGSDHLQFGVAALFDPAAEVIVNSGGTPTRMPVSLFRQQMPLFGGAIVGGLTAVAGGIGAAPLLPGTINVIETSGAGCGVKLNPAAWGGYQEVWNPSGSDVWVYADVGIQGAPTGGYIIVPGVSGSCSRVAFVARAGKSWSAA